MHIGWLAEALDAIFILTGKTAKVLNARGLKIAFIIDSICLIYWCYVDIERQLYAQAVSVTIGLCINIYGYRKWTKLGIGSKKNEENKRQDT